MKRKILYCCLFSLPLLALKCEEANFTPDSENQELPAYTEDGNNIWGAIVNNVVFRSSINCHSFGCSPGMSIYETSPQDSSVEVGALISFVGFKAGEESGTINISFQLPGVEIPPYGKYENIAGVRFELSDSLNFAEINGYIPNAENTNCTVSKKGFIQFNRFEELESTSQSRKLFAAGIFELYIENDSCSNILVEQGRFDFDFINQ